MLAQLKLDNVGPLDALDITLARRVNVLTGDNGLGKSFILDIAWWALTRTWRELPALPTAKSRKAEIAFKLSGKSEANKYTSTFDSAARSWTGKVGRPASPGLVLYASVDGGFAVWDPARNYWRKEGNVDVQDRPPAYLFRPAQVWDGLESGANVLCNGLIRDWALWQKAKSPEFEHLKAALGCVQANTELAQAHLLLGFANDMLGKRGEATDCYAEALKVAEAAGDDILSSVNVFVVADAKKYSQTPFTSESAGKIEISFDNTSIHDL